VKVKLWLLLITATLIPAVQGCKASPESVSAEATQLEKRSLTINSANGVHRFIVEVARTADEQSRGLMFRESLPANGGMIFPMEPPREASFWMKNTLIPLDMIFIRADGSIARIEAQTVPFSLDQVASGEPVAAVLELVGGKAAALGISEDDKVSWKR
jgi:uncharacterized protein